MQDLVYTAIDFETTGTVPGWSVEPWQIGIAGISLTDGVVWRETHYLRVAADRPFNKFAPGRHASIREELACADTISELWDTLSPQLVGVPLIAHNIGTERAILRKAAPLANFGPWFDTLKMAREALPGLASYALGDVVAALGLEGECRDACPEGEWHDALYDAIACGLVFRRLAAG